MANTPAGDHWRLEVSYANISGSSPQYLHIAFLPNGSIDTTHTNPDDLEQASTLLEPEFSNLSNQTKVNFDYWQLINWLYVSYYWLYLADLGTVAPTIYYRSPNGNIVFSSPTTYPPTNNIFLNSTLFHIYSSIAQNTILPMLNLTLGELVFPTTRDDVQDLPETTFVQNYLCTERRLKSPLSFLISVIAADYAFIMGGYSLIIFVAELVQKHRHINGSCSLILYLKRSQFL